MARPKADRNPLEDKDNELWTLAMRDAKPLKRATRMPTPTTEREQEKGVIARGDKTDRPAPNLSSTEAAPRAIAAKAPEEPSKKAVGIDRRTAEKLRRGLLAIEARLDLHGHTQKEAHAALSAFIEASWRAGRRCLIVITGKGGIGRQAGVLRTSVPGWLDTSPLRQHILAVAPAQPKDGGAGALYVLLRRKR